MSNITRALRMLPVFAVTGKTKYNSFDADAAIPCQDTGTRNDSTNAGGALAVTAVASVAGLVAWKDYIPVQEETGRTVPHSTDANGYFPIKLSSGNIFAQPEPPITGTLKALLQFRGTNTSTSIVDETGKAVTLAGNTQLSTTQYKWGRSSVYFDGVGDSLDVGVAADFVYGSSDFSIEFWIYQDPSQSGTSFLFEHNSGNPGSVAATITNAGVAKLYASTTGSSWDLISGAAMGTASPNTWTLFGIYRKGTNIYAFKDGVLQSTSAVGTSTLSSGAQPLRIGGPNFKGYFGGMRVITGQGLHDAAYAPNTAQFANPNATTTTPTLAQLACGLHLDGANNGTTFTDVTGKTWTAAGGTVTSTAQQKYGSASLLPGASGYISTPDHADFAMGSGNFTLSTWVYPTSDTQGFIFEQYSGVYGPFLFQRLANGAIQFLGGNGTAWDVVLTSAVGDAPLNTWTHVEVTRKGNIFRMFINGTYIAAARYTGAFQDSAVQVQLGGYTGSLQFRGYIDDFYLAKGVAYHETDFTAPTGAFNFV